MDMRTSGRQYSEKKCMTLVGRIIQGGCPLIDVWAWVIDLPLRGTAHISVAPLAERDVNVPRLIVIWH